MKKTRNVLMLFTCITTILFFGCTDSETMDIEKAAGRIEKALYQADVSYGGTNSTLDYVLKTANIFEEKMRVTVNFKENFDSVGVQYNDFVDANRRLEDIRRTYEMELGNLFEKTNHLTIVMGDVSLFDKDSDNYFKNKYNTTEDIDEKLENMNEITIEINKFKEYDNKILTIKTEHGDLYMPSTFFSIKNSEDSKNKDDN